MINLRIPRDKPIPLDGLYVHVFKDGVIHEQGRIEEVDRRLAFVRLLSWIDGSPLHTKAFNKRFLRGKNCRLYCTAQEMRDAYDRLPGANHGRA